MKLKKPRKATGPDFILLKVIKFISYVINSQLFNFIKRELDKKQVLRRAKTALVTPIFKKNERNKIENYRSVSSK